MRMIFTILWAIFFIGLMLCCLPAYLLLLLLKPFLAKKAYQNLVCVSAAFWGRIVVWSTGSSVILHGSEKIPSTGNICYISNHQGLFDIPVLLGFMRKQLGFIAKKELFKIPILSYWMKELHCIFIDRKNPRNAIKSIESGANVIRSGYPIVIFPEGTRSKSNTVGTFHYGSIKLAMMAEAIIVPITVCGTWRIFEIDKKIHPVQVEVNIFAPIYPEEYKAIDKQELMDRIRNTMQEQLSK